MPKTLIHILSADPESRSNPVAGFLRESAGKYSGDDLGLAPTPDAADVILFAEAHPGDDPLFYRVALHPVRKRHPQKCFFYSDADHIFPVMRGLFPVVEEKRFAAVDVSRGRVLRTD